MTIILTKDELADITGYRRPADQLEEMHRQGYWRARRSAPGSVICERAHYEAVCSGAQPANEPRVRKPQLRLQA